MSENNNKGSISRVERVTRAGLAVAVAAVLAPVSHAGEPIYFDHGGDLQWSVTASYGIGVRMEDQDDDLINNNANGDDGNRNFDKHALTSHRLGLLAELIYTNDNNWGGVLRATTFYDDVYHRSNDNDSPATVNKPGAHDEFTDGAEYFSGGRSRFLDAYLFTDLELPNNQYLSVKAGRHAVSWGEGLFYPGVNGAQGPVDVVKANTPGTETKEILLPNGQVSADWNINPLFGLSAYYQYEWLKNELSPVGSYFSTTDIIGPRPEGFLLAPGVLADYEGVNNPSDQGQYGVRAMIRPNFDWEFSVFHINYHDKNPATVTFNDTFSGYKIEYFDDIKLTGASVSTRIGDTQVSSEISYRDGAPILLDTRETVRGKGVQAQASFIHTLGDMPWARGTVLVGEVVHVRATDAETAASGSDDYTYDLPGRFQTKSSTAYTLQAVLQYPGLVSGWDVSVPVNFSHVVDGKTPLQGAISGGEGDRRLSVGTTWKYLGNLELDARYVAYMGDASIKKNRQLTDRDQFTFAAKYSF
ncbi:DUF1302 domain-containing protein [Marinobacter sp. X15-166B]|uniref:DUF1302 domain-containing protein n=1 Tax=Marinobacter sp. X15-166B TaxID=1897620 RepID=UPI00085BC6E3|nr:DUF1302 family protein [Marinobacter sp. X15-166B]OEY66312.1 hypothetical protein BG841_07475 [Marinobacter sp. X15-166B]